MNQQTFDYASLRAQKARFARLVAKPVMQFLVVVLGSAFLIGGVGLLVIHVVLGWILIALAAPCIMLATWISGELKEIPAASGASIDAVLESSMLGALPREHTQHDLVRISWEGTGGKFLAMRYGLAPQFFNSIVSNNPVRLPTVWQEADRIRQTLGLATISAPMVQAALIQTAPNVDILLAKFQLDVDDVVKGVAWYHHIDALVTEHKQRKNDGGLGRDWSFGYTPKLSRFAVNISERIQYDGLLTRDIPAHQEIVERLVGLFSQGGRQNAALIGPLGSGKTTLVHGLAKRLIDGEAQLPKNVRFNQVFVMDPSSLIAQAHGRGELEGLIQELFYEAFAAKNVILFLDDAHLFFEEGTGSVDLSNVLLPVLEGGALKIILAMDEQNWLRISQRNAALAQYINRVPVAPTSEQDTMLIMEDQLILMEHRQKILYMYQALGEAYRLSDRYMQDQAMPGKALMLLESAAGFADGGLVTAASVKQAIEKTVGVKVGTADNQDERETLLNLEDLIHERMINQTHAVKVVSDALRRARAGRLVRSRL